VAGRGNRQLIIALNFAEVSITIRGRSVFQWTKYLAGRPYAWFTGWIYIFAGILTVTAVVVTLPLTILPALYNMGWHVDAGACTTRFGWLPSRSSLSPCSTYSACAWCRSSITPGSSLRLSGMVIFAIIMLIVHRHQSISVVTKQWRHSRDVASLLCRNVHESLRDLRL